MKALPCLLSLHDCCNINLCQLKSWVDKTEGKQEDNGPLTNGPHLFKNSDTLMIHHCPSLSVCADLPPPPEPPPEEDRLQAPQGCVEAGSMANGTLSSLERSEYSSSSHQRKGSGQRNADSKFPSLAARCATDSIRISGAIITIVSMASCLFHISAVSCCATVPQSS